MSDGHTVLGQGTGFIRANSRSGSESFDRFQVFDETIFLGHSLGGESETDSYSSEETFGHIGDNDTDEENNSFEPVVTQNESKDEKSNSEENSDTGDDVDEMLDFLKFKFKMRSCVKLMIRVNAGVRR